ncbi:protein NUCLEAR FUSION DEFECTIVE 4 isoform X1 [Cucumis melo var. makuwa]|uniref:Protein NUCLEAR FUSION DEFECTIVE 4 isoform X1 n=2 Tax=Cucumis melo TaxID=3656 RepID=A0A5A7UN83_CUCMM|nr:protein NUCLEAR FUSION DEFECTIVE 4 isoform X1 [Cucumis melo]KAA0056548.1 protein NUCLEAR FUSION DEFECTIVE 4 isoform X1 [Cucumis melo var. makuwa]TYK02714.1 protein NUCLEAR FUSION DEFECTIVE 4 isoform X1 [Cucumis melo var. makuwa]
MGRWNDKLVAFINNRWLVFVAAIWLQSWAGIGYLFGSISPVIKTNLSYNQRQVSRLGVAKDLGDSVGFLAATLTEILPFWGSLLVGAIHNIVGYGWVWLIVTGRAPVLPLWAMCVLVFVGTNGETYFNTVSLVSCVQNFPKSRGPVVGILKGFAGLSGAILTQIYAIIHSPDSANLIFMVAVGPALVAIGVMFFIRPVAGHRQVRPSDGMSFSSVYGVCLLLAAYLMGVMLIEDLVTLSPTVITIFTVVMFVILLTPFLIPVTLTFSSETTTYAEQEALLPPSEKEEPARTEPDGNEVIFSEVEDEKSEGEDLLPASERQKRIAQLQAKLLQAAAEGAVRVKRRKGPRRGEDFTLGQALIKADFWLIFSSHLLGSGTGLTVIDNLGQMSQSLGYDNTHIFVSLISIWNFLGRVGGGYLSEIVVRDFAYPRPIAMTIAQVLMIFGHVFIGMGWPGAMYIGTLITGLGYGAHWAIVPATASELFGLKKFGALYNFITLSTPMGSLIFSGLIASSIYDSEAEKQARNHLTQFQSSSSLWFTRLYAEGPHKCEGAICFFLTCMIMAGFCAIAGILSLILVYRTKGVYHNLYGKSRTSTLS